MQNIIMQLFEIEIFALFFHGDLHLYGISTIYHTIWPNIFPIQHLYALLV